MKTFRHILPLMLALIVAAGATSCKDDDKETPAEPLPKIINWNGSGKAISSAQYGFRSYDTYTTFRLSSSTRPTSFDPGQFNVTFSVPNDWINPQGVNLVSSSQWKLTVYANGTTIKIPADPGTVNPPAVVTGTFYALGAGSTDSFKIKVSLTLRVYDETAGEGDTQGYYVPVPLSFTYEGKMEWNENLDGYEPEDPDLR